MPQGQEFSFGSIIITRDELLSIDVTSTINQYLAERVTNVQRVIPQSLNFDVIKISVRIGQEKYIEWLNYFKNAPTGLQQTLDIGYVNLLSAAGESMNATLEKIVFNGATYTKVWKCDITFIKSF